jgi:hypothetical protein
MTVRIICARQLSDGPGDSRSARRPPRLALLSELWLVQFRHPQTREHRERVRGSSVKLPKAQYCVFDESNAGTPAFIRSAHCAEDDEKIPCAT